MKASVVALAAAVLAGTACGSRQPRPPGAQTGELRIVEVHVPGSPVPIEGEFSYVRVSAVANGSVVAERRLDGDHPLRLRLDAGRYSLSVWHRTCDGNCGLLDPPSDRCEKTLEVPANDEVRVTIENSPGSPCRIVSMIA
jgi:hypothetical protein